MGRLTIPGKVEAGTKVNLSIRPEQIVVGEINSTHQLQLGKLIVDEVSFFGTHHRCQGRLLKSNLPMIIRLPQHQPAKTGDELTISTAIEDVVLLTQ
jgi:ABC-type sugar transport system ATPase subunit